MGTISIAVKLQVQRQELAVGMVATLNFRPCLLTIPSKMLDI
jgi:hypothetical protein